MAGAAPGQRRGSAPRSRPPAGTGSRASQAGGARRAARRARPGHGRTSAATVEVAVRETLEALALGDRLIAWPGAPPSSCRPTASLATRCSPGWCARSARVVSLTSTDGGARAAGSRRGLSAAVGDSIAVDGCCLTVVDGDRRTLAFDAVPETLARTTLGRLEPGSAVNLEPALRAGEALGGHYVQGHVDGVGRVRVGRAGGRGLPRVVRRSAGGAALLRREGLGRGRRRLADRRRCGRRRASRSRSSRTRSRRPRSARSSPGGRSTSRRTCSPSTSRSSPGYDLRMATAAEHARRSRPIEEALDEIRERPVRGRRRRPRPRERGRPDDRGRARHARGGQLHGHARARRDLPLPDRAALRRARTCGRSPRASESRHGTAYTTSDRRARGHLDGRLRGRPRPHDPRRDRPGLGAARPDRARAHPPAARARRRRAPARRPDRGGRRPRPPRRADPGRGRLRDHERGRDDGPRARPGRVLRPARPEDDHRRRPDRVPPAAREARRAGDDGAAADRVRRVPGDRVPRDADRQAPRRARQGRGRGRRERARPRPLRVPDRRRLPLAALRLRRAARARAGADRRRGVRASCSTWRRRGAGSAS